MQINLFELKRRAREAMKACLAKKPAQMSAAVLVYLSVIYMLSILLGELSGYGDYVSRLYTVYGSGGSPFSVAYPPVKPVAGALAAAVFIMRPVAEAGFVSFSLRVTRDEEAGLRTVFDGFSYFFKTFAISIMQIAATAFGLLLFIAPGIYFYYKYRFAIYIMFDHPEMSAIACMRESARLTGGNKMGLFMLDVSFIGWLLAGYFVAAAFLPILDVYIVPYMGFAHAGFYNVVIGYRRPPQEKIDL